MKKDLNSIVCFGDVHGQIDKLIRAVSPYLNSGRELIFTGDLIDRAALPGGDAAVLDYVRDLQENPDEHGRHVCRRSNNHWRRRN